MAADRVKFQTRIKKGERSKEKWDHPALVIFFVAPALLVTAGFIAYPAVMSVFFSLHRVGGAALSRTYVGLENWERLFADPVIWQCIWHTVFLIVVTVFIEIPLAFGVALILARAKVFGRDIYRTAFFFPVVLSVTVAGVLWSWVYNPQYGILNEGLRAIGLSGLAKPWLAKSNLVLPAVTFVIVWKYIGLYIVIFMAAVASIPQNIYDVAALDGTNLWQQAVYVIAPMLREVFVVTVAIGITASIHRFDLVYIMTTGGPIHHSEVLATYMYKQAFLSLDVGYASTVAFFLFVLTLGLVVTQIQSMKNREAVEF